MRILLKIFKIVLSLCGAGKRTFIVYDCCIKSLQNFPKDCPIRPTTYKWDKDDDPWTENSKNFPYCAYVRLSLPAEKESKKAIRIGPASEKMSQHSQRGIKLKDIHV